MEVETAWGVSWRSAGFNEIMTVLLIVIIILLIFIFIRLNYKTSNNISHEFQLLLFKAKNRGLTNFQYKIVRGMAEMLKLKHPSDIMNDAGLFEDSIAKFIKYMATKDEEQSSLVHIFKDIVITYEKIFMDIRHKKPLETFDQLNTGHLVYFYTDENHIFLGKLEEIRERHIKISLFRKPADLKIIQAVEEVHAYLWRPGDAEYTFDATIIERGENYVHLTLPDEIIRGKEVRLPYVNVIIPCHIFFKDGKGDDVENLATLYKMGEHEIIVRSTNELTYSQDYRIEYSLSDFNITARAGIISEKTVTEKGVYYYTFKFKDISEPARRIIRTFIYEHL